MTSRAHHHGSAPSEVSVDDLLARLRGDGHRVTTARRVVLAELLRDPAQHPTVDELTERIQRDYPSIHQSTVYRTLDMLADAGIVVEVHLDDGPISYHLASDDHHHAVCTQCGSVLNLPGAITSPVAAQIDKRYGFRVAATHLTFRGLCAACQRT